MQAVERRCVKGAGLPAARLRGRHHVTALEGDRDSLGLNRGGLVVSAIGKRALDLWR
jgi:hypothetical protein